jgi:C4-dicarboxylate transporter|tara:strand:+ start:391 stop:540 length:150 start_codon:yes stop_codon:yes gene_type:complete
METFIGIIVILAIAILLIKKYKPSWYEVAKNYFTNTITSNKKTTKSKKK